MPGHDLIVIGASAGGVPPLLEITHALPKELPAALLVVFHVAPLVRSILPEILTKVGGLKAVHALDRDPIRPGTIYIAPPDHHLLVEKGHVHLSRGPRENRFRPAIDPLFRSAALHYGPRVVGVILSGALYDGSAGLYDIKRRGGVTVVQDPQSAITPAMPLNALTTVAVDHCLRTVDIAPLLQRLVETEAPGEKSFPVPKIMELEERMAAMEPIMSEEMSKFGTPSGFVCPECHGSLWRLNGDGPIRLRCHVGHAFSPESLTVSQQEQEEENLWRVLQSMDERMSFMRQMASEAERDKRPDIARTWEGDLSKVQAQAAKIRTLLSAGR